MIKVDIAGLKVDAITKQEFLDAALKRIQSGQKTFVITPYSEFLYHVFQEPSLLEIFNKSDFSLADGIGIFWATKYLSIPLTAKSYWGKIFQGLWQMFYSLAGIIFNPSWIKSALPEKIVGADLVWDLAKMAADNNLSIFLLGGFGDTTEITARTLFDGREKVSQTVSINTIKWSNKNPGDPSIIDDINKSSPDILLVAYGPIKQEKWIVENWPKLNTKLAIGVGGSFDYIAGKKSAPPKFVRYSGLEWLWRLITQPYRFKRIINATFGLANALWRYKVFESLPLRPNVVSVILNEENKILIGKRNQDNKNDKLFGYNKKDVSNYWQLPQGGMEPGEDIKTAAAREILEEVGLKNLEIIFISKKTNTYKWQNALRPFFGQYSKYSGQEQHIIYMRKKGLDSEVKIDDDEFEKYKWVNFEDLDKIVHPERLPLAKIVLEDLKQLA